MSDSFLELLAIGGKSNSLGEVNRVVDLVLVDNSRLDELYGCLFDEDAWLRMRAADALEKVCRRHPAWLVPYVDRIAADLGSNEQASIRWHLAQIYGQIELTPEQKRRVIDWLKGLLAQRDLDWIVAANAMDTLVQFTKDGSCPVSDTMPLLELQRSHKSNAVVKRADKLIFELMKQ